MSDIQIRDLTTIDEFRQVVELEKAIWGYTDDGDLVTRAGLHLHGASRRDADRRVRPRLRRLRRSSDPVAQAAGGWSASPTRWSA